MIIKDSPAPPHVQQNSWGAVKTRGVARRDPAAARAAQESPEPISKKVGPGLETGVSRTKGELINTLATI